MFCSTSLRVIALHIICLHSESPATEESLCPLLCPGFVAILAPAVCEDLRSHLSQPYGDRPSKFIVVDKDRKQAINIAWDHGGLDFQARFDKSTGQTQEMKEGCCGFCK